MRIFTDYNIDPFGRGLWAVADERGWIVFRGGALACAQWVAAQR